MKFVLIVAIALSFHSVDGFLRLKDGRFYYKNDQVFLSGANIAWIWYGTDFGTGAYALEKSQYEYAINEISFNGGNVVRVWVHTHGSWSPKFDRNGTPTGEDTQSLIYELGSLLDYAAKKNVFVILVLWDLTDSPTQMIHLYSDQAKLQSYLDKVLKPLVTGLKDKPALAAWSIVNEPMGSVNDSETNTNRCYDATHLKGSGAGWANRTLPYKDILRFINIHADAIKSADPKALVTLGENGERPTTHICEKCFDHYSDECLIGAGGKANGTIDFYSIHSYTWDGKFTETSPFKKSFKDYNVTKPWIVEEFSSRRSESHDPAFNYRYIYEHGYSGLLAWTYNEVGPFSDIKADIFKGTQAIRDRIDYGKIKINIL